MNATPAARRKKTRARRTPGAQLCRRGRPPTPQLREKILRSAEQLFGEKEFHLVLTEEVAARAGVGKGSVYRQFGSKEQLYATVVIDGFVQLQDEIRDALCRCDSSRERITAVVRHTLAFFWNRRQFFALLHDTGALPRRQARQYFARREQLSQLIRELLSEGAQDGALRANLDVALMAESLLGMLRGVNFYRDERVKLDDAVATALAIFLDGCSSEKRI